MTQQEATGNAAAQQQDRAQRRQGGDRPWMQHAQGLRNTLDRIGQITNDPQGATVGTPDDRDA